jgi:hypothetical protein
MRLRVVIAMRRSSLSCALRSATAAWAANASPSPRVFASKPRSCGEYRFSAPRLSSSVDNCRDRLLRIPVCSVTHRAQSG